jgi:hypothetical protein
MQTLLTATCKSDCVALETLSGLLGLEVSFGMITTRLTGESGAGVGLLVVLSLLASSSLLSCFVGDRAGLLAALSLLLECLSSFGCLVGAGAGLLTALSLLESLSSLSWCLDGAQAPKR